jgi:hypothetical protein
MSCFKPVDSQRAVDGIDEPDFADAGALVNREFTRRSWLAVPGESTSATQSGAPAHRAHRASEDRKQ